MIEGERTPPNLPVPETLIWIDPDGTVSFRNLTVHLRRIANLLAPEDPRLQPETSHEEDQQRSG